MKSFKISCRHDTKTPIDKYFIKDIFVDNKRYDFFRIEILDFSEYIVFDVSVYEGGKSCGTIYGTKPEQKILINSKNKIIKLTKYKKEVLIFLTEIGWEKIIKFISRIKNEKEII